MVLILVAAIVVALAALGAAGRAYARTRHEISSGAQRTRFLALWGLILAAGFALASAVTAVAFIVLSRCAG